VQVYCRGDILIDEVEFEGHFEGIVVCHDAVEQVIADVSLEKDVLAVLGKIRK